MDVSAGLPGGAMDKPGKSVWIIPLLLFVTMIVFTVLGLIL